MATRKTAEDFPSELLSLFDLYVHGLTSRRDFLNRAAKFALAGVTADGLAWKRRVDFFNAHLRGRFFPHHFARERKNK
jgi:hypothetical protein